MTKGRAGVYAIFPIFLSQLFNYAAAATVAKFKFNNHPPLRGRSGPSPKILC